MVKTRKKSNALLVVILATLFISAAIASTLFFITKLNPTFSLFKPTEKSIARAYRDGKPEAVLQSLNTLEPVKRGSGSSLLMYGKSWYLLSLKKQRENKWRDYGKNENDWFAGIESDSAVYYLRRAQDDSSSYNEATLYLAVVYMEKGWYEQSTEQFLSLLSADSANQEGILNYAVLQSRQRNFESAAELLKQGTLTHPTFSPYWENLFWLYALHLNQYENAVSAGDHYLKIAEKSDVGVVSVYEELTNIFARFPEFKSDTLLIEKKRKRKFEKR